MWPIPKSNGYQSLHTILFGPYGVPLEVQIRSRDMDDMAEIGIAAHWLYKSSASSDRSGAHRRARAWLRRVVEMQTTAGNPQEFLEHVKVDLFPESVYAFNPKGRDHRTAEGRHRRGLRLRHTHGCGQQLRGARA